MNNENKKPQIADNSATGVVDLLALVGGGAIARARFTGSSVGPQITVMQPGGSEESGFEPAQAVVLYGLEGIKTMRELCDRVIKIKEAAIEENKKKYGGQP